MGLILPIVGIVWTFSPSFNLNKTVVLPDASKPTMRSRRSLLSKNFLKTECNIPMMMWWQDIKIFKKSFSCSIKYLITVTLLLKFRFLFGISPFIYIFESPSLVDILYFVFYSPTKYVFISFSDDFLVLCS